MIIKKPDCYALEKAIVSCYECDKSRPVCLYDFTVKSIVLDQMVYSIVDNN
jgi:hypothetical protein